MNFLKTKPLLRVAAQIASEFRIDPVTVLNATKLEWEVRMAAFEYVREEKKKEADKIKAQSKRGRRR